jgi:Apea-like HEPN
LEVLDLVRAVMCLFSNSSMTISSGGEWNPINTIMLGGMHSLHLSNGELAENFCWCEPAYRKIRASTFSQNLLTNHTLSITWAYDQLTKVPYRRTLKESLIRYVRAFDENDNNTVILKGWGAIEKVVVAGEKNCDLVSKRCSYLFEDREYHKQIIEHLREYRNASVHAGEYLNDVKTHCYQLQYYFLKLISFYLSNAEVFTSIEEANSFLDLPNDISKLHREKELLEKAIKFMEPT